MRVAFLRRTLCMSRARATQHVIGRLGQVFRYRGLERRQDWLCSMGQLNIGHMGKRSIIPLGRFCGDEWAVQLRVRLLFTPFKVQNHRLDMSQEKVSTVGFWRTKPAGTRSWPAFECD
jgi:hypothetical protein